MVPHFSTSWALCHLTSEIERDPVHSTWYGRQRKNDKKTYSTFCCPRLALKSMLFFAARNLSTVAILAQGTQWAGAISQALFLSPRKEPSPLMFPTISCNDPTPQTTKQIRERPTFPPNRAPNEARAEGPS